MTDKLLDRVKEINELRCQVWEIQDKIDRLVYGGLTQDETEAVLEAVYGEGHDSIWL